MYIVHISDKLHANQNLCTLLQKIKQYFANYSLKTLSKNTPLHFKMCISRAIKKLVGEIKPEAKALRYLKVEIVLICDH